MVARLLTHMQSIGQVSMHQSTEIRVQEWLLVTNDIAHLRTRQLLRDPRGAIVPPLQTLVHSESALRVLGNLFLRLSIDHVGGIGLLIDGISSAGFAGIRGGKRPLNNLGGL